MEEKEKMEERLEEKKARIQELKKEKNAVILAHYYVPDEVQEIADYIGDSYYLSQLATKVEAKTVVLCGVSFMGESAKLLNPDKTVLLPDEEADCPMAHMCTVEKIEKVRAEYPDVAVVCYVNSTAELKAHSDVCVTSSNALNIVKALPNEHIYFIPDENLARYVASQIPEKHIILNDGYCPIHKEITVNDVAEKKKAYPQAEVLAHPECTWEVLALADYIGSTSGILAHAAQSDCQEFIVATETGVFYELKKNSPDKVFHPASDVQLCPGMKKVTLDRVMEALLQGKDEVILSGEMMKLANRPLNKMLEMAQ